MKVTLIEIKNNLQGNNNRMDRVKNQINDLEHKEAKNNHTEQEEKRIQKNEDSINSLWDTLRGPSFASQGCQMEKRKSKKLEIYLKKQ